MNCPKCGFEMVLEHEGTNFERYFCIACRTVEPIYRISERGKEILRILLDESSNANQSNNP